LTEKGRQKPRSWPADAALPTWRAWASVGGRKLARDLAAAVETLSVWQERARARRELARLDDRMLRDIGISSADVWQELEKPFWRD
jgi:uncharacterized protein YjiS (DUF1127 family)